MARNYSNKVRRKSVKRKYSRKRTKQNKRSRQNRSRQNRSRQYRGGMLRGMWNSLPNAGLTDSIFGQQQDGFVGQVVLASNIRCYHCALYIMNSSSCSFPISFINFLPSLPLCSHQITLISRASESSHSYHSSNCQPSNCRPPCPYSPALCAAQCCPS